MKHELTRQEANDLSEYLSKVVDRIPAGLTSLKDAATLALFEINCYAKKGIKLSSYRDAIYFAQSIPRVNDLEADAFITWMLNDQEHLKYLP